MMDPEELHRRRDLRQTHLVFSIDPKGCEDVDDTLSVRFVHPSLCLSVCLIPSPSPTPSPSPLPPPLPLTSPPSTLPSRHLKHGVTELGVHIADVSYFVPSGSLTDQEAQSRSTTVYLADRRYDMLPPVLSADLCSLLSNIDRQVCVSMSARVLANNVVLVLCQKSSLVPRPLPSFPECFHYVQVCCECGVEAG